MFKTMIPELEFMLWNLDGDKGFQTRVKQRVQGVFRIGSPKIEFGKDYSEFAVDMVDWVLDKQGQDKGAYALIDDDSEIKQLVDDVSWIVGLQSSGLVERLHHKPERMLVGYVARTRQIDGIFSELTSDICASECYKLPIGCCTSDYYNLHLGVEFDEIQRFEAIQNGWDDNALDEGCLYHTDKGCALTTLKPARCINHLCHDQESYLRLEFGKENAESFYNALFAAGGLWHRNAKNLFRNYDNAIAAGKKLIELRYSK